LESEMIMRQENTWKMEVGHEPRNTGGQETPEKARNRFSPTASRKAQLC
jgi:hypothetical protein